jgi:DNA-binding transcriptional ArsR family regulator
MQQANGNLDQVFFALSDGTRRAILSRLSQGSTTIGELAQPFEMTAPAISRHMRILENAGLIERRIKGRKHHCSLATGALKSAEDWINFHRRFWEGRLDALDDLLRNQKLF